MKNQFLSFLFSAIFFLSLSVNLFSQSSVSISKIETVLKLAKFIDWPVNSSYSEDNQKLYIISEYNIPLNYEISNFKNAYYKNWQIIFKDELKGIEEGSVVFVANDKKEYVKELISLSLDRDILTIADDYKDFCANGGMINLKRSKNRQNFEINYKIIQSKSLNISSKVLALAKICE